MVFLPHFFLIKSSHSFGGKIDTQKMCDDVTTGLLTRSKFVTLLERNYGDNTAVIEELGKNR